MNNRSIKVAAIAVAMLLATQNNITKADNINVGTFSDLTTAIKKTTAVGVNLTNDITWTSVIKLGSGTGADKISSDITINGNNFSIISNNTQHLGLDISKNTNLTINNVSINNFDSNTSWGGALYNAGTLKIENVTFSNNKSKNSAVGGGAIANADGGIAELNGKLGFNNNTNSLGGAIYNSSKMAITSDDANFKSNQSLSTDGGAIYNGNRSNEAGDLTLSGKFIFEENSSKGNGGAIYNTAKIDIATNDETSIFNKNTTTNGGGGAIANVEGGEANLKGNYTFSNNTSNYSGGAIYNSAQMTIESTDKTSFADNTARANYSHGGAIWNGEDYKFGSGDLTLSGLFEFENNKAGVGGAIYNAANMSIINNNLVETTFKGNSSINGAGGAIFNSGTLAISGDYKFENNTAANLGGAIYNEGAMSLAGTYDFVGNTAKSAGGAIANNSGSFTINGTRANSSSLASILFHNNSTSSMGGAIYIKGKENNLAFLNVNSADFINNSATSKGGAIFIDDYTNFNIIDSHFVGNSVNDPSTGVLGWGGAIGLASTNTDDVHGYIKDSIFLNNSSSDSGGAIPSGTVLTIVNSVFQGNTAKCSGGAVSYDPKKELSDKALKLIADGGDTVFAGNSVTGGGTTGITPSQEGLYIGNSIVGSDGKSITGQDGNDSNIYFNAGNSGRIIFNDIVDASGTSFDDLREKRDGRKPKANNNNIQLNKAGIYYKELKPQTSNAVDDGSLAPDDGTIIFNNTVKGANLVLHNGTLAFGQKITDNRNILNSDGSILATIDYAQGYITPEHYFENVKDNVSNIDNLARITLKGGTLDLANNHIEEGSLFNPDSIDVVGSANLRLDMNLGNGTGAIDYIDSVIKDSTNGNGSLLIDKILFNSDITSEADLGTDKTFQFVRENQLAADKTELAEDLKTVITSKAGYSLALAQTNTTNDSIKVTKIASAGGLPVAVSIGQDEQFSGEKTYVYNATEDEKINNWTSGYNVLVNGNIENKKTSNVLQGELLQINGNGKNVIATDNSVVGIAIGKTITSDGTTKNQELIINDVYGTDTDGNIQGWKGFNSAIINNGGVVSLNNSVFSSNSSSTGEYTDIKSVTTTKSADGGAILNTSGKINVKNTSFYNNSATAGKGGAIYNAGTTEISATDGNTVEFTGNTAKEGNDIYNIGKLNLIASDKSSIIFNGGISGDVNNLGKIAIGTADSYGTVLFNNTVANQDITLNNGTLKIGAIANNNAFDNVNLTLQGGTLNLQNNQIDTININNFTIGSENPQLLLDVNLDSDLSDNIAIAGNSTVENNGTLYIGPINILKAMSGDKTSSEVKFINSNAITAAIEDVNSFITVKGITYSISLKGNDTLLIEQAGKSGGFAYEVINSSITSRTYQATGDENVETWIANDNNLAGMRFQIVGNNKSIYTENGLEGIRVGTFEGNPQQLDINNVSSFKGFNSAVINNGGNVIVNGTTFDSNLSTTNGGAIQNNSGNVEINGGSSFVNNSATVNGGAIYNGANGTLTLKTDTGKDILFSGNTATNGNDIYNDGGTINMQGSGNVEIDSIAGTGNIVSSSGLILKDDNSNYLGTFEQSSRYNGNEIVDAADSVTVNSGATFFGGESNINAGSLIWNTANDLVDGAKLTIKNANLTIGNGGKLTIKGNSSIENANTVTTNGNLILAKDMTVKTINGNGTVHADNSTLTFNSNSILGNELNFTSENSTAIINEISDEAKAGKIISTIANGTNNNLNINITNSNANADISIDGANLASLNFSGNVKYSGQLTGSGNITNSGDLQITGNESGFVGTYTQNSGSTTVDTSANLFGGTKNISAGILNINKGSIDYKDVILGNNTTLNQTITETENITGLDDTKIRFNGSDANANFTGGKINLSKIDNGKENTISFTGSDVTLAQDNYQGNTIYKFDNDSTLDLLEKEPNVELKDYVFDNLVSGGNTKLNFNIKIEDKADGSKYIKTDTLTVNGGNQKFTIGDIYISGEENGWNGNYTTEKDVLTGATFNDIENEKITLASTSWIYDITKNGDSTIKMTINNYANENTLYNMNDTAGTRFFQFSEKKDASGELIDQTYNIGQSLDETKSGNFTVSGYDKNKCTISGEILDENGNVTGRGSFFDIKNDNVKLTIKDVTIANASKATSGSVVNNESTTSEVNISNAIIKDSSSSSIGGAIYNKGTLNITDTEFSGNSAGTVDDEASQKGGAIYNDGGTMTLTNVTIAAQTSSASNDIYQAGNGNTTLKGNNEINSSIRGTGTITNEGTLTLTADNSDYTGSYTQKSGATNVEDGSKFFGGESTIENGELNWNTNNDDYDVTLKVEGGTVNIGNNNENGASLILDDESYINKEARVNLFQNSEIALDGGSLTLDSGDTWNGDIFIGDENNVGSGTLTIDGLTSNGGFAFNGGTVNLVNGGALTAAENDIITKETTVKIGDGTLLAVNGGNVTLDKNTDWASNGGVLLEKGTLTINDFAGTNGNGILQANNGTLDIKNSTLTVGKNSRIDENVETAIFTDSNLKITDNGYVKMDNNDSWGGKISLDGGTLDYAMPANGHYAKNGDLIATKGNLNLLKDSYLDINQNSKIDEAVAVNLEKGATVNIKNNGELNLNSNDIWAGLITTQTDGILKTNNVDNSLFGGQIQQNRGTSTFDNNSNIYIDGKDSYMVGGTVEILNGSTLHLGSEVTDGHFYVNNLNMGTNSTLSAMNNTLNNYTIVDDMTVNGTNNVSIDVDARNKVGDTFIINNLRSDNNGTLKVSDFNFIGQAPIDRHIKFKVFDANSIDKVDFAATDKQILTPIGFYDIQSVGGGYYTSNMTRYNPQVFRGQVATLATYNNQLVIDDMLLNHVTLDSERTLAQGRNANKYASTLPQFAPYQYKKEDGGLWFKSYVNFENLSLTQGLKVGNNSYGSLIGADFPVINMKRGWRFMPTAYIGYNGAHQTFNGVGMYQNGGQGGFMGTFMKNDFIGSVLAYGGGYNNEMSVAGYTDRTGNWFAGTAAKLAYNLHPTKHFTIQPTAFVSYNIFGRQNWGTDYGAMSMNSGLMNGVNVAPGLNFIYARESWSVYATFQYMYNINDQVGGKAGNVDLASVEMKHGYIQYGVGVTKTWKDRLNSFFQIVFRNGGRTGVGFQLGLNYTFDWLHPSKTKSTKTTNAKKIKSNKQSLYQENGDKTIIKSLSMK